MMEIEMAEPEISNDISRPEVFDEDSSDVLPIIKRSKNIKVSSNMDSSDDDSTPVLQTKRRVKRFTGSESDTDKENDQQAKHISDNDENKMTSPSNGKKRIILKNDSDSDSDSDKQTIKNEEQQLRMKNKRNKLREKFKSLVTSRTKEALNNSQDTISDQKKSDDSCSDTNDEGMSINNIKQDVKKSMSFKPSICDPDTSSDEEIENRQEKLVLKSLNQRKSTKPTSPKPSRMSAKQAMENMKKIKSESNRLLREKEISLPYHKPKAISIKDIMGRRKAAVTADGKALPIKMNEDQLKQYVQILEQRQKEIMELCKSDSDEEQDNKEVPENDTISSDYQNKENLNKPLEDSRSQLTNESTEEIGAVKEVPESEDKEKTGGTLQSVEDNANTENHIALQKECSTKNNIIPHSTNESVKDIVSNPIDKPDSDITDEIVEQNMTLLEQISKTGTELESQNLQLHYDSESYTIHTGNAETINSNTSKENVDKPSENDFSDEDINMEDIDKLIENAESMNDETHNGNTKSLILNVTAAPLGIKPKLTGAPGVIIDLDDYDSDTSKKLSGVELLKERYTYFSKLKSPEELEREKEKRLKPGAQHLKLKQELEEVIAEQRSIEWAKRLNEEKQQQMELKALRGEESDVEEDIEKIEAKLEEKDVPVEASSEGEESESEDEIEEAAESIEKPRFKNPMIDDEAEESDCDDDKPTDINESDNVANEPSDDESSEESSEDDSEDEEQNAKPKKGRILKAFEDSDDENDENVAKTDSVRDKQEQNNLPISVNHKVNVEVKDAHCNEMEIDTDNGSQIFTDSQDDEIQLAQRVISVSDDMFTSQDSASVATKDKTQYDNDENFGTQSFSILNPNDNDKNTQSNILSIDKLSFTSDTQTLDNNLEAAAALCSGSFTQNFIPPELSSSQQPLGQSQAIGEDVLALCTGNFYENNFVSQSEVGKADNETVTESINDSFDNWTPVESQGDVVDNNSIYKDKSKENSANNENDGVRIKEKDKQNPEHQNILQSIIDELHEEEIESSKPNKYFPSNNTPNQIKKKLVIESDDEGNENANEQTKKKKLKKRKLEQRALQISDDEEEQSDNEEENMLDIEDATDHIVDYDSEENEIEVKPQNPKKKNKANDFFENEAELTSEDEWVGSGDEDEADLDRMEREEGDDDTFNEGKLQRKLGKIHMRDVLDQDKREVRLIQELLFEDGDLGGGHRQRKFRWKNADDGDDTGPVTDEFATPEEEFESEEQWRKQRHEREVFLRQMQEQDNKEDSPNISLNRTTIIKANLSSRTTSSVLLEANKPALKNLEKNDGTTEKTTRDIPSPKKGFTLLQQNYHSSLLTRGRGALARLAALATPLAIDEDSTKVAAVATKNQRNFVFTTVTKEDEVPKVTKRKAESKLDTPRLVKKLKTKEKQTLSRNSLLDHLRV